MNFNGNRCFMLNYMRVLITFPACFQIMCFQHVTTLNYLWPSVNLSQVKVSEKLSADQPDSELFQFLLNTVHYLKISEQRSFSSEQRRKSNVSELKKSALIQWKSELISFETALISTDIFHVFLISAELR